MYYIGAHATNNIHDDYLGSGVHIKQAVKKYGKKNFKKEILFSFDNEIDMWHKEAELVTHDIVESDGTYNLIVGGRGGTTHSQRTRAKIKENNPRYWKYNKRTPEQIEKHRIAVTGRKRSDEEKRSISEKMKGVAKPRACCI